MTLEQFKKYSKRMPDAPGVYFFLGKNNQVLYIGKATSLRDRVRSYFSNDLSATRGPIITRMVEDAKKLDWREVDSVLEALLLEASLIKNYKPKANTDLKDDKSFNYVVVTKENFPKVLVVRGRELAQQSSKNYQKMFGPFPHGLQLKEAMKIIRRIFPYRDEKCTPCEEQPPRSNLDIKVRPRCKPCFNRHIGLCPGVCTGEISKTEYRKIVRRIVLLFQGKKKELLRQLERDMKRAAKEENFEEAKELRRQVFALQHIQDVSLIKDEFRTPQLAPSRSGTQSTRIEAYDVAHLRGASAVGVMTVVEDGMANKNEYRKFRLRATKPGDDAGGLREILSRRLGHDEWPLPRLIAVDGAAAQMNAAQRILDTYGLKIPIVGVIKDEKHRPREIRGDRELFTGRERDILLANAEAHRFAITYHRKRSRRNLTMR